MAKSKKTLTNLAIARAALGRALAVVDAEARKAGATELAEGSYPVALDVSIAGDVTVGASVPEGDEVETPTVNAGDVLMAILAPLPKPDARRLISSALKLHKRAGSVEAAAEQVKAARGTFAELTLSEGRKLGLTETRPTPGRRGAVAGKPFVQVTGNAGANALELEVAGE